MSLDIRSILSNWPFRPDEITARRIKGDDGKEKIQLRLDLGILQMEIDGRPDGREIHELASWLDYHRLRQKEHDEANPDARPYVLEPEDCIELLREGVQYYHRYLCFWHLEMYELCARDTKRNLQLFAFVREHARNDQDKLQFDQWRPYVTMMHARAVATPLVELEQWEAAVGAVDAGIRGIEQFLLDYDKKRDAEKLKELNFLRKWKKEIEQQFGEIEPPALAAPEADDTTDPAAELKDKLKAAIEEERYEDAAAIRDELTKLGQEPEE